MNIEKFNSDLHDHREVLDDAIQELFDLSSAFRTVGNEKMARDLSNIAREINITNISIGKSFTNALYETVEADAKAWRDTINAVNAAYEESR